MTDMEKDCILTLLRWCDMAVNSGMTLNERGAYLLLAKATGYVPEGGLYVVHADRPDPNPDYMRDYP